MTTVAVTSDYSPPAACAIPAELNGMKIVEARGNLIHGGAGGSSGSVTVQVRKGNAANSTAMLSTVITITTTNDEGTGTGDSGQTVATGDILTIDVETVTSSAAVGTGLIVTLGFAGTVT